MAVLLLRFAAPLQSWGADSKFETRRTNREPTKSAVIGMLAAAVGLRRDQTEELAALNKLHFGVRVDKEGELLVDFHIAKNPEKKDEKEGTYVTYRHYLQDAVFLVGIESEDENLLRVLNEALQHPAFPLYLGRRSCPPTLPLTLGIKQGTLLKILQEEPVLCERRNGESLRIVIDAESGEHGAAVKKDVPISFNPLHRQYGYRSAKEIYVTHKITGLNAIEHDPFFEL